MTEVQFRDRMDDPEFRARWEAVKSEVHRLMNDPECVAETRRHMAAYDFVAEAQRLANDPEFQARQEAIEAEVAARGPIATPEARPRNAFTDAEDQAWLADNPRTVVDTSAYPIRVAEIRTRDDFEKFVWFCNWDEFKEKGGLGYSDCEQGACWTQKTPDDLEALRAVVEAAAADAERFDRYESRAEAVLRAVNAAGF